ncbi:galactose mutarotase-like domain-containing protein [Apiosordaria backusii]|uniref:Galactose mutarotase-like domain-containing protein n=1 Tax=Apiosordaria backusii TaxID=314023 RepID=A0AA40DRE6_9PEZI|nr:galactose mutarotase-like domain-containing protein [Apiosordaria backusii]
MADAPVASFLPLGAIIQELRVGGLNIVQGFPTQELYVSHNGPFFGETIGRVANRISNAKLDSLNGGKTYQLAANNGVNNLHGGVVGWGKRIWNGPTPVGIRTIPGVGEIEGGESVKFALTSEDGDEGFPGTVEATVIYTVGKQVQDRKEVVVLGIEYEAELVGGADETVINMTNHSYFNLTGGPSIEGTKVTLATNTYLPVDEGGIPTGGPAPFSKVQGQTPFVLGAQEPDIDDCFVVNEAASSIPIDTRSEPLTKLVSASHPETNIHLEVLSTEPAFQFYTGKYIDVPEVAGIPARAARSGFCVEPSRYVNAANVDEWKSQMLLKKGEKYGTRIVYRAWKE